MFFLWKIKNIFDTKGLFSITLHKNSQGEVEKVENLTM